MTIQFAESEPQADDNWEMVMDGGLAVSLQSSTEVDVLSSKEVWSEYHLSDGTVLRIKPIMIGVARVPETQTTDGELVYSMKSTLVTDVRPARGLAQ